MSPLERLENLATEVVGRGAAIELGKVPGGGWFGKIWRADGTLYADSSPLPRSKAAVIRALRDHLNGRNVV